MLPSNFLLKKRKRNEHIAVCNAHIAVCNQKIYLPTKSTFSRPSKFSRNVNPVGKFSRWRLNLVECKKCKKLFLTKFNRRVFLLQFDLIGTELPANSFQPCWLTAWCASSLQLDLSENKLLLRSVSMASLSSLRAAGRHKSSKLGSWRVVGGSSK